MVERTFRVWEDCESEVGSDAEAASGVSMVPVHRSRDALLWRDGGALVRLLVTCGSLLIALAGMPNIVACQFVAPEVRVASPLILLIVGLAIGFLPQVGAIEVEPHIILEIVLPPLLFSAASTYADHGLPP